MHLAHPRSPVDQAWDHSWQSVGRAWPVAAGAPSRGRGKSTISQRRCHRRGDRGGRGRRLRRMRPSLPAQVHQTAFLAGASTAECPDKARKREAGVQGACRFGFGPWWPQSGGVVGQTAGARTQRTPMDGVGPQTIAPKLLCVAPAPCSFLLDVHSGEAGAQRPLHQPACSSSSSPRWPPVRSMAPIYSPPRTTAPT